MTDIISLAVERGRRGGPPGREALESRISALMTILDEQPVVAVEIIQLCNEVWLLDADEAEAAQFSRNNATS